MANTKSAIKRIRRISKQTAVNKARKSRFRNALKKMNALIDNKKKDDALKFLPKLRRSFFRRCPRLYITYSVVSSPLQVIHHPKTRTYET